MSFTVREEAVPPRLEYVSLLSGGFPSMTGLDSYRFAEELLIDVIPPVACLRIALKDSVLW